MNLGELNNLAVQYASTIPMAPVIGIKDIGGDTALTLKMDWWAAAQLL